MKKVVFSVLLAILGVVMSVASCTPKAAPQPAITPTLPSAKATVPTSNLPPPTSQDADWDKTIAEAKKEGKITMYTFSLTSDMGQAVTEAFEAKYGIKVEYLTGVGAQLIERIKTEQAAKRFIADTLDTSTTLMFIAKNGKLTVPTGNLPTLAQKNVWLADPRQDEEGHLISFNALYQTPYVNTTLVKPGDEPKSYQELLDPKWKGKIVAPDPNTVPNLPRLYSVMVSRKIQDEDFFRKLAKQEPKMAPTVRDDANIIIRGEAALSVSSTTNTLNPFISQGAPVKPLDVKEGVILAMSPSIAIVNNAPHPNAARLMINWLVSSEGQTAYQKIRRNLSIRTDVPDFTPIAGQIKPTKTVVSTVADELEAARVQTEKVVTKLMGLMQ